MRKLLMQALQDSAAPDASSKVLSLTAGAAYPSQEETPIVHVAPPSFPDAGHLSIAKRLLNKLSSGNVSEDGVTPLDRVEWTIAMGEAEQSLQQLEADVHDLEAKLEAEGSRAVTPAGPRPGTLVAQPRQEVINKLSFLGQEVAMLLERPIPGSDINAAELPPLVEDEQISITEDENQCDSEEDADVSVLCRGGVTVQAQRCQAASCIKLWTLKFLLATKSGMMRSWSGCHMLSMCTSAMINCRDHQRSMRMIRFAIRTMATRMMKTKTRKKMNNANYVISFFEEMPRSNL